MHCQVLSCGLQVCAYYYYTRCFHDAVLAMFYFHNFIFLCCNNIQSGPVVETIAYDLLLEAAMHAQLFHSRNLRLHGSWKWLLIEFADYYGVSDSYTKLRCL